MDSSSTLSLGVGGTNGSQYDRLEIRGTATLNGTLVVNSFNNFRPTSGNAFETVADRSALIERARVSGEVIRMRLPAV
jgi:hypothetical protein